MALLVLIVVDAKKIPQQLVKMIIIEKCKSATFLEKKWRKMIQILEGYAVTR